MLTTSRRRVRTHGTLAAAAAKGITVFWAQYARADEDAGLDGRSEIGSRRVTRRPG